MQITVEPIGFVRASRVEAEDDYWGGVESSIELTDAFGEEALVGLADFSHAEILYHFHRVDPGRVVTGARHPRGNRQWPQVGIFAQRAKSRPNRIGSSICRIVGCRGRRLLVAELDAIDGTPVLDIKPVMAELLPRDNLRQPQWSHELMREYWLRKQ